MGSSKTAAVKMAAKGARRGGAVTMGAQSALTLYDAFDHLATMVAVVETDGVCVFANAVFEEVLGLSRRSVMRESIYDWFVDPTLLKDIVTAVANNEFATSRLQAELKRNLHVLTGDPLPVQVIVTRMDLTAHVLIELVEIEQQAKQER